MAAAAAAAAAADGASWRHSTIIGRRTEISGRGKVAKGQERQESRR